VAGLIALLDHPDAVGGVFNVGAENEISIEELARSVISMTGSTSTVERIPYDVAYEEGFEDMFRRVPDISRIANLTGWRPTRGLEEILADAIAFERSAALVGEPS
jgi:UDP-glucose 4-epimerase